MAFLPDSTHVVSSSDDRTVRIWDATMGTEVMKMEGHRDWVRSVSFSPDSATVRSRRPRVVGSKWKG